MPFDSSPVRQDVQNLLTLADALEREHEGFRFYFPAVRRRGDCGTVGCAIGLAAHVGILPTWAVSRSGWNEKSVRDCFGITSDQAIETFCMGGYGRHSIYGVPWAKVTPAQVAAQLRRIASEKMSHGQ